VDVACLTAGTRLRHELSAELCTWDVHDRRQRVRGGKAAQAIKTAAAFSGMNGPAQPRDFRKSRSSKSKAASTASGRRASGVGERREPHWGAYLDHVTRFAAFTRRKTPCATRRRTAQRTRCGETVHERARGWRIGAEALLRDGYGGRDESNHAVVVDRRRRGPGVLELFPHLLAVGFLVGIVSVSELDSWRSWLFKLAATKTHGCPVPHARLGASHLAWLRSL